VALQELPLRGVLLQGIRLPVIPLQAFPDVFAVRVLDIRHLLDAEVRLGPACLYYWPWISMAAVHRRHPVHRRPRLVRLCPGFSLVASLLFVLLYPWTSSVAFELHYWLHHR
jgi:hypothetical protein